MASPQVHLEITHHIPDTSPPVGMKRSYLQPTLQFLMNWQKSQKIQRNALLSPQLPSDKSARPQTRPMSSARSSSLNVTRVMSGRPRSKSDRPTSAQSVATSISVESATGRVRIKTPHLKQDKLKSTSRPSSAVSSIGSAETKSQTSEASLFLGGRRMETLLQALHTEQQSGGFFRKYVEKSDNEQWVNCLNFWHDVQEYHCLFYAQSLDAFVVEKKAKAIYSHFIVTGCEHPVGCTNEIAEDIFYHISPPFEELFDQAEVHAITVLYTAWVEMTENDKKTYGKVELIEVNRRLETKSKYVHHLQRKGLIKERVLTPDDPMEGYSDPVYDESLLEQISEDFRDYTLEKLVHNRIELEHYRQFLEENYASMDLKCWMDIEAFRRIPHTDEKKRDAKAKEINQKYFNRKYFFGANSPAGKEGQDKVMAAGGGWGKLMNDRPPNPVIIEAQKFVRDRLEKKWLPLFLLTPGFAERQKPRTSMDSVVDDVLVQKRKKSQAVWKLLESRWVSSSQEIITFRNALLNPVTSIQFRRYVSIQGDSLENDVLFWQEVQKYKDLYHAHTDDSIILQKINTIINCFLDSQLPPTLQIDIPQEIADKIIDHKHERSPYLFRESQLIVFRYLFGHWNDFCNFRANLAEEKIMPTIERRRKHAKVKDRKRQQEVEERMAKS
ncbi:hypothetical protein ACJMK2_042052 [Sinanodonta woodiana]|uniref:RGS domain-containing protein n=1 Tax=Sinanodonta woodiana TaxID=1069815 RepID=A0ABD3W645_SINWO